MNESASGDDLGDVAKRARLHHMLAAVLEEVRELPVSDPAVKRAAELAERTLVEVGSALPEVELRELALLVGELGEDLSSGETRVVDAQLLGWLDGLAMAEQMVLARSALDLEQQRLSIAQREAASEVRRQARGVL